jgi:UDP-3-O-[3-hydroxymyristoyl] glucosamine N-acyltransferase
VVDASLGEIAALLGGELVADPSVRVTRIGPLDGATPDTISFLSNPRYRSQLTVSHAGCVIVAPAMREAAVARGGALVINDPYLAYARLSRWWDERVRRVPPTGVHPSAVVDASATIAATASIGPSAVVEAGAEVGEGAVIGALCFVGANARVGAHTRLAPRVTLGERCSIGERGIVHSGVVIGADGFGFAPTEGRWDKIAQLGAVRIGNDVEIGANTCIDRGALGDTVIEDGVKLDNLIQIAHNVRIGEHTVMAGCAAVAGSTTIGPRCTIGGSARVQGHITLVEGVNLSTQTFASRSILKPGHYTGVFPIDDNATWEKNAATLRNLHTLRDRVRALEKSLPPAAPKPLDE